MFKKVFNKESVQNAFDSAFASVQGLMNSGHQYGRSYAAALTLLVAADFDFDATEFTAAVGFIQSDGKLREMKVTSDTIEYFKKYTDTVKEVMTADNYEFPIVQAQMIEEVKRVPDEYKNDILYMVRSIMNVSGSAEKAVGQKIIDALT